MVILFMLFVAQFSIACACLAFNKDQQHKLAYEGWHSASMSLRNETQMYFDCCGFENASLPSGDPMEQPSCSSVCCIMSFTKLFIFCKTFDIFFFIICLWVLVETNPGNSKIFLKILVLILCLIIINKNFFF